MTVPAAGRLQQSTVSSVLEALLSSGGKPLSGAELSRRIGVSRSAVWKAVGVLKDSGIPVVSLQSRGYLLGACGNLILPTRIRTLASPTLIGTRIIYRHETVSTNLDAVRLAEEGAPEGTVVIADAQSGGRGRLGRRWESPAGCNLYCSVVVRPSIPPHHATHLTFLAALAVCDAVASVTGITPSLKWPNDLLIGGKKCAGLLNEMSAEADRIRHVILGIGVNLNMSMADFPDELVPRATSLSIESGREVDRTLFAARLIDALDHWYGCYRERGFDPVRSAWTERSWTVGKRVRVTYDEARSMTGRAVGIDEVGALLVVADSGGNERVLAGDVTILKGD